MANFAGSNTRDLVDPSKAQDVDEVEKSIQKEKLQQKLYGASGEQKQPDNGYS